MYTTPPEQDYIPHHVPPGHSYPVHKPPTARQRKPKPPASLSRLHRPLIRFYCNDCKHKFRSRILANRNNNAVQHYCSLYQKIITRKVDSHVKLFQILPSNRCDFACFLCGVQSNKCKGDHGMGPCVVKRTDIDPDSDGEDETKAAYYADKGKKRPMKKRKSPSKKRKRTEMEVDDDANGMNHKRQRLDNSLPPTFDSNDQYLQQQTYFYPPPNGNVNGYHQGYYHQNGYMHTVHNDQPPMMESNYPPPPITNELNECLPPTIDDNGGCIADIPPPPALEALEPLEPAIANENENDHENVEIAQIEIGEVKEETNEENHGLLVEVKDNAAEHVLELSKTDNGNTNDGQTGNEEVDLSKNVEKTTDAAIVDDEECINEETEDEDDGDLLLKLPSTSPAPKRAEKDNEDDDLALTLPE